MEENIQAICDLLEYNQRLTVSKICQVGLNYGNSQAIITNSLGFHKVCAPVESLPLD